MMLMYESRALFILVLNRLKEVYYMLFTVQQGCSTMTVLVFFCPHVFEALSQEQQNSSAIVKVCVKNNAQVHVSLSGKIHMK